MPYPGAFANRRKGCVIIESMKELFDRAQAKFQFEWLSGVFVRYPRVGKLIVGDNPTQWWLANTRAAEVSNWQSADGFLDSGRVPSKYRSHLMVDTNRALLDRQARNAKAQPAAAFRAGPGKETVLVTTLPFMEQGDDEAGAEDAATDPNSMVHERLKVAFGVGKGALDATVGIYLPEDKVFSQSEAQVTSFAVGLPLEEIPKSYPGTIIV